MSDLIGEWSTDVFVCLFVCLLLCLILCLFVGLFCVCFALVFDVGKFLQHDLKEVHNMRSPVFLFCLLFVLLLLLFCFLFCFVLKSAFTKELQYPQIRARSSLDLTLSPVSWSPLSLPSTLYFLLSPGLHSLFPRPYAFSCRLVSTRCFRIQS